MSRRRSFGERLEGQSEFWAAVVDADREMQQDARRMQLAVGSGLLLFSALLLFRLPMAEPVGEGRAARPRVLAKLTNYRPAPAVNPRIEPVLGRARRVPVPAPLFEPSESPMPLTAIGTIEAVDFEPVEIPFGIPGPPPPRPAEGPLPVGGDVSAPVKIHAPDPVMPDVARRARLPGLVILEATIDREGIVRDVRVLKSAPLGMDRAAVEAVERWRFEPGTLRGEPVPVLYNLTVRFDIQ